MVQVVMVMMMMNGVCSMDTASGWRHQL